MVLVEFDSVNKKLDKLIERNDALTNFVLDKHISIKSKSRDFRRKYEIQLPLNLKEDFVRFDEKLMMNDFLKSDVVSIYNLLSVLTLTIAFYQINSQSIFCSMKSFKRV